MSQRTATGSRESLSPAPMVQGKHPTTARQWRSCLASDFTQTPRGELMNRGVPPMQVLLRSRESGPRHLTYWWKDLWFPQGIEHWHMETERYPQNAPKVSCLSLEIFGSSQNLFIFENPHSHLTTLLHLAGMLLASLCDVKRVIHPCRLPCWLHPPYKAFSDPLVKDDVPMSNPEKHL